MNRRHFLASISATAILPKPISAAQNTLQLKAEAVMQKFHSTEMVQTAAYDFSPPLVLHNLKFTYSLSFQPRSVSCWPCSRITETKPSVPSL